MRANEPRRFASVPRRVKIFGFRPEDVEKAPMCRYVSLSLPSLSFSFFLNVYYQISIHSAFLHAVLDILEQKCFDRVVQDALALWIRFILMSVSHPFIYLTFRNKIKIFKSTNKYSEILNYICLRILITESKFLFFISDNESNIFFTKKLNVTIFSFLSLTL